MRPRGRAGEPAAPFLISDAITEKRPQSAGAPALVVFRRCFPVLVFCTSGLSPPKATHWGRLSVRRCLRPRRCPHNNDDDDNDDDDDDDDDDETTNDDGEAATAAVRAKTRQRRSVRVGEDGSARVHLRQLEFQCAGQRISAVGKSGLLTRSHRKPYRTSHPHRQHGRQEEVGEGAGSRKDHQPGRPRPQDGREGSQGHPQGALRS